MRTVTGMDLTAAMEVDNPGEMSMAHPSTTSSMEVDNSPPSIVSALPNLALEMPETQVNAPPPPPLLTQSGRP